MAQSALRQSKINTEITRLPRHGRSAPAGKKRGSQRGRTRLSGDARGSVRGDSGEVIRRPPLACELMASIRSAGRVPRGAREERVTSQENPFCSPQLANAGVFVAVQNGGPARSVTPAARAGRSSIVADDAHVSPA